MPNALRNIAELCRHEYLRERRSLHFSRNIVIWGLKLFLWTSMALALPHTLEVSGIGITESLPLLLLADQAMRWFSQRTPILDTHKYRTLPIRRWHVITAYLLRMLFMPINFIWLPALWPQWWFLGIFILSGYLYLAFWHCYLRMMEGKTWGQNIPRILDTGGLLSCEMKMRLRHPGLRKKIRNGLIASILLTFLSITINQGFYTDFVVLHTLTFPTLPLLTARLGYEQRYMPLLLTRMHNLKGVYLAKYIAATLLLLPSIVILLLPVAMDILSWQRLVAWTLATALAIYPALLLGAPRSEVGSPTAQMLTLATLTFPILTTQLIQKLL